MSWCKVEFSVAAPKDVNPYPETDVHAPKDTPPLTMMSISLRTIVNHRENKTEVLCATTRTWEGCESSCLVLEEILIDRQHRRSRPTRPLAFLS